MIEKLRAFFLNPRKGKSRRTGLILTIVALVEILAIMLVSTSAWVESISSIKVYTTIQDDPNGTKGIVQSAINQQVEMNEGSSGTYDLSQYFRPSGAFHFAPASSVDGKTMYFPEHRGGSTTNFRIGSISDKNVNYIAFTIRTKESNPVSLAFDQVPTISFGGTALNQNDETSKLVRFAIGDNSGNFKVFSLYKEKFTEQVPAAETIVPTSTADPKEGYAYTTVYPFKDFVKGKDRACQTTANGTLSFSMWIQDPTPTATTSAVYNNKTLSVSNLKLIIVKPFVVKSTYKSGNSYVVDTNGVSGTVAIENGDYGKEAIYYAVPGVSIDLHAIASEANGYQFMGWSNTLSNTSVFANSSVDPYSYTVTSSGTTAYALEGNVPTLYAKFNDEHDLYLKPDFKHVWNSGNTFKTNIRYAAYVFGRDPVTGAVSGAWYNMTASGNYFKCTYKGSATTVIFCYMNPDNSTNSWDNRWLQTYDLSVPARPGNYYYVVTCRQVLDDIEANGVTYDNPRNAEITQSGSHDFGTNKLLGYWEHNYVNVSVSYTTDSDNSSNRIYCALTNTVKNQTTSQLSISNNKVVYHAWWYEDSSSVKLDGTVYQDYYGADDPDHAYEPIPQYKFEKNVTLNAEDSSDMDFAGWYSDAAGTQLVSVNKECPIVAPDNGTYSGSNTSVTKTYYAKYTRKPEQWYLFGLWDNWANGIQLTNSGTTNVLSASKELYPTSDSSNYTFKLYEATTQKWYSVDYTFNKSYLSCNTALNNNNSTPNMQLYVENRAKYTFNFNTSTRKISLKRETIPTIKISVDTEITYGTMSSPNNYVKFNGESNTTTDKSKTYTTSEGSTTSVTVVATANTTYYTFDGWYENGSKVWSSASYSFNVTSSTEDRDLVAKFKQKTKYIEFQNANDWGGTVYCYAWQNSTGDNPAAWRGTQMTSTNTYTNGHRHYSITLWTKYDRVKFNTSNGNETGDLTVPTDSKYIYHNSGSGGWY